MMKESGNRKLVNPTTSPRWIVGMEGRFEDEILQFSLDEPTPEHGFITAVKAGQNAKG